MAGREGVGRVESRGKRVGEGGGEKIQTRRGFLSI